MCEPPAGQGWWPTLRGVISSYTCRQSLPTPFLRVPHYRLHYLPVTGN
jgi:hypothetical protein